MKRTSLALMFAIALIANPAAAAVSSSHGPAVTTQRKPPSDVETLLQIMVEKDNDTAELPLECRGYYLRAKSQRPASSRCE